METKGNQISQNGFFQQPINLALSFFLIALAFRLIDIFVLNLDNTSFDIITSKVIPLVLLLVYIRWSHRQISALGIHRTLLFQNIILGMVVFFVLWAIPVALEFLILPLLGIFPSLVLQSMDSFTLTYLIGFYIVNSFMEEGLFRGLMTRCFMTRVSVFRANLLQSFFFSIWHLVWPMKELIMGTMTPIVAFFYALNYLAVTFIFGLVAGYMFQKTSSLAGPIVLHTIWNLFAITLYTSYTIFMTTPLLGLLLNFTIAEEVIILVAAILAIKAFDSILKMRDLTPWDSPITN